MVWSHPSRVRGLKLKTLAPPMPSISVAPLAGARIEISRLSLGGVNTSVAPLAGAWIEMHDFRTITRPYKPSHPSRVRGLK